MKILINVLVLMVISSISNAQFGEIRGTVTNASDGLPLPGATVIYYVNGTMQGVSTDSLGHYKIKPLVPGVYDIRISFVTFSPTAINGIVVSSEKTTFADAALATDNELPPVEIRWTKPLIDPGSAPNMTVLDAEEIEQSLVRDVRDLVASTSGVFQKEEGGSLNVRGSRSDATQYIIDGVKIVGPFSLPKSAIAEVTVITGGVPAQYVDATGGIVLITTKRYRPVNR
jgi:hypothetical protein